MLIDIITIFPEVVRPYFSESILKRARDKGKLQVRVHNLRDYTLDKHKKVDDRPFGGGPGMVLSPEPIFRAVEKIGLRVKGSPFAIQQQNNGKASGDRKGLRQKKRKTKIILLSPKGKKLDQKMALGLSSQEHLILICGHYEGVDERVRKYLVDEEVSIGDYVLTGGELAAMVLSDCLARLIPGVLGHDESNKSESFCAGLLEYPQYTRPASFRGKNVPKILLSGNHQEILTWRKEEAVKITKKRRPDLLK